MDELNQLLLNLPNQDKLTETMKQKALNLSLIPDTSGKWPSQTGYEVTYDSAYAALLLVAQLRSMPVTTSASSESTSASQTAPDWDSACVFYQSISPIYLSQVGSGLGRIDIKMPPHAHRRYMGGDYDIDTSMD